MLPATQAAVNTWHLPADRISTDRLAPGRHALRVDSNDRTLRNDSEHRRATHNRWMATRIRRQEDPNYLDKWRVQQCGSCRFWVPLARTWGTDYGACTNPASPRDGNVAFEHDGCHAFADAGSWQVP
jgi:hypothetical protein